MELNIILCFAMFGVAVLCLLSGFPVAFTLAGVALAFAGFGWLIGEFPISLLTAYPQGIFGVMNNETLVAVPLFIFMGVMLERSKVAEELLDNMGKLFGALPGGLAFSVCIVGALLAASTGIVGATVVTMGLSVVADHAAARLFNPAGDRLNCGVRHARPDHPAVNRPRSSRRPAFRRLPERPIRDGDLCA